MNNRRTTCKACGEPLNQIGGGGHRRREYCGDTCKQAAYRDRKGTKKKQEIRQRWAGFQEETQNQLEWLMTRYGRDFAQMIADLMNSERAYAPHGSVADEALRERVTELEQQLARYRQVIDLDSICPWTALTLTQEYLRSYPGATIPIRRQGRTIKIVALDNHARTVSESQGLLRLNDEKVERCRLYVLEQLGRPITIRLIEVDKEHLVTAEQELTSYRLLCDLTDRQGMVVQALALGARIGYKPLPTIVPPLRGGQESWEARLQQADIESLAKIIIITRHYAENLIWLEIHDELQ